MKAVVSLRTMPTSTPPDTPPKAPPATVPSTTRMVRSLSAATCTSWFAWASVASTLTLAPAAMKARVSESSTLTVMEPATPKFAPPAPAAATATRFSLDCAITATPRTLCAAVLRPNTPASLSVPSYTVIAEDWPLASMLALAIQARVSLLTTFTPMLAPTPPPVRPMPTAPATTSRSVASTAVTSRLPVASIIAPLSTKAWVVLFSTNTETAPATLTVPEPATEMLIDNTSSAAWARTSTSRIASTWADLPTQALVVLVTTLTSAPGVTATLPAIDRPPATPRCW